MHRQYILDIDNILKPVERVVSVYYRKLLVDLIFVKTQREPIDNRNKLNIYAQKNMIVNTPVLPWLSAHILKNALEFFMVHTSRLTKHYYEGGTDNYLTNIYDVNRNDELENIVAKHLVFNSDVDINKVEHYRNIETVTELITKICLNILKKTPFNYEYIHSIDITQANMVVTEKLHILEHRYNEVHNG